MDIIYLFIIVLEFALKDKIYNIVVDILSGPLPMMPSITEVTIRDKMDNVVLCCGPQQMIGPCMWSSAMAASMAVTLS